MVTQMIESKVPSGPGGLRRCFQYFDLDGSGSIDYAEFKHVLHMKANLAFDEKILAALMREYDDDGSGDINFRKFTENVLGSKSGQVRLCTPSAQTLLSTSLGCRTVYHCL